ncbi:MAG: FAD-dependent oxidoreductase [Fimbriimonadales bacterium]
MYDVVVCGGGTAGAVAAIKSAKLGAKTLVVEELSGLGGTQAMGWVTPMMPNYLGDAQLSGGINLEVQSAHEKITGPTDFVNGQTWYDPVAIGLSLEQMARAAGVEMLFNASVMSASVHENRIQSLDVWTKQGSLIFEAKMFVDATGDADLAFRAGAATECGDTDGRKQPTTLRFAVANVNVAEVIKFFGENAKPNREDFFSAGYGEAKDSLLKPYVEQAIEEGVLESDDLGYFQVFTMHRRPNELAFNCPRLVGFDPLDAFSRSNALLLGREKVFRIHAFCKRFIPGFASSYVSVIAPLLGVRETRRVKGHYWLTEDDHQSCRKFENAVARSRYPIDIHLTEGGIKILRLPKDDYHEIPYGCLVAQDLQNLFMAGRNISASFTAQSATRIQPVCRALGEAAGAAAALCAKHGLNASDLPYEQLRPHLDLRVGLQSVTD